MLTVRRSLTAEKKKIQKRKKIYLAQQHIYIKKYKSFIFKSPI